MSDRFRVSADAGQGGHNYLASVSDLVSALIFVFIIMLAVFAYQLADITEEQKAVTENLKAHDATRHRMLQEIARQLRDSGIRVEVLDHQGVLRLSENSINFSSGSETPASEHLRNVGHLARAIAVVAPCYVVNRGAFEVRGNANVPKYCQTAVDPSAYECREETSPWLLETLLIEGHTDDVPVAEGPRFGDNLELSSIRAATVQRMIIECEPGVDKLRNTNDYPILSTSGYGDGRPVSSSPQQTDDTRRVNRRIDLRFLLEPPEGALSSGEPEVQVDVREEYGERQP